MLFRKPVVGEYIKHLISGYIYPVEVHQGDTWYERNKSFYSLVEVTPVEPPENRGNYVNLYQTFDGGKVYVGGVSAYLTRKEADRMADTSSRVGCVDLNQLKGRFDD